MANCYAKGIGVAKDEEQAAEWRRKATSTVAAEGGDNNRIEIEDIRAAAEQGVAIAQRAMGIFYYEGSNGVAKDEKQAVYWFRKAAEQGQADAQCCLGVCYFQGIGVEKDEKQAVYWLRKAAEQGQEDAKAALKQLGEF